MHPKSPRWLEDIAAASARVAEWTTGATLDDYEGNLFLRSAIERNFEIIGEALPRLSRQDPAIVDRITAYQRIIAFRDPLIRCDDVINDPTAWGVEEEWLPVLLAEGEQLLP